MMASDMPNDPYMEQDLIDYFPTPFLQKYSAQIKSHHLRKEIIASRTTNSLVDRAGNTLVVEFIEKTGKSAVHIIRAYTIAHEVFDLRSLWAEVKALDNKVLSFTQTDMLMDIHNLLDWIVLWLLRSGSSGLDMKSYISESQKGIAELMSSVNKALSTHYIGDANKQSRRYTDECVPEVLALKISGLVNLYYGLDIVRMATHRKCQVLDGAKVYFTVGTRFRLGRLRATTDSMGTRNHWQQLAMAALVKEIYSHQLALASSVMDKSKKEADVKKSIEDWIGINKSTVSATEQLLNELWTTDVNYLSMITVASRQTKTMTKNNS